MAKHLLDKIVVIDIESTCWEKDIPVGQTNEIIEVGICTVDIYSGNREHKESILIKPEYSTVSKFCTQLTTLTQEQVDKGTSFKKMCFYLENTYLTRSRVWASYGDYDRKQFSKQCSFNSTLYPFGSTHINIKNLFAIFHTLPKEVGMSKALRILNLPLEGTHHRAMDDAWNISAILAKLILSARAKA